ncbi:MAG: glycosyltransferase family 39 protein [Myxococcota bacterium]|nr:glycosyltransferase family 39 protein [Myxococcota bacterium]
MAAEGNSGSWKIGLAIVGLAFAVRTFSLWLLADIPTVNDENLHLTAAVKIAQGQALGDAAGKAPGVTLFYALLAWLFAGSLQVLRLGNIVASCLTVGLLYASGHLLAGRRAGIAAGVGAALYPTLVGFSHYLWAETLYVFFVVLSLWAILEFRRSARWRELVIAGLALGLGALTREVGLGLALLLAVFLWWHGGLRRGAAQAAVVVAVAGAVIAPWSLHLHGATGDLALVTRTTWLNLYVGNEDPKIQGLQVRPLMDQYYELGETRSEREAEARQRTLRAIWGRMPWWPIEKLVELRDLFAPTSIPARRLLAPAAPKSPQIGFGRWRYEFEFDWLNSQSSRLAAAAIVSGVYALVAVLGVVGLMLIRDRTAALLLGAVVLAHVAPVLLAFGSTRFRVPIEPVLLLGAACLVTSVPEIWREASVGRRRAAFLAGLVMALIIESGRRFFLSPLLV